RSPVAPGMTRAAAGQGSAPGAAEYTLGPDVFFVPVQGGTARLLDLGGKFYAVPAVGALMLRETLERGVPAAVAEVSEQFGASPAEVQAGLEAFLADLERKGLVRRGPSPRRAGGPRAPWPSRVLGPLLRGVHRGIRPLRARAWLLLALARLSLRLLGWAGTVAAWQRYPGRAARPVPDEERAVLVRAVDDVVRRVAATHVLSMGCKERSLCCWSLLRAAGVPAALNVGIYLFPLAGHCWCECGPWTPGDDPDACRRYTLVARYE